MIQIGSVNDHEAQTRNVLHVSRGRNVAYITFCRSSWKKKKTSDKNLTKQQHEKANKGSDDNFRSGIIVYFQNSRQNILCGIYSDALGRNVVQLQR